MRVIGTRTSAAATLEIAVWCWLLTILIGTALPCIRVGALTRLGIARVFGAGVIVIAIDRGAGLTKTIGAKLCAVTEIAIAAFEVVIRVHASGLGIAGVCGADICIVTI